MTTPFSPPEAPVYLPPSYGRPVSCHIPRNLYLMHQQGTAGGLALLQNPNQNAVQTLTDAGFYPNARVARRAITRNYGTGDMSGADFANMWAGKVAKAMRQTGGAAAVTAGQPGTSSSPGSLPAPSVSGGSVGGFSGASATPLAAPRTPQLLAPGDPRLKQFAPGAAVEQAADGTLNVKAPGFTPEVTNSIYERNAKDLSPYTDVVPLVKAIRQSFRSPSAAGDLSGIEAAARVFNPKATVRQGVMKSFDDTNGLPDQLVGALNQLNSGGANARLSPQTRAAILQQAEERAAILRRSAQPIIDAQTAFARRNGLNAADILPPIEELGSRAPTPAEIQAELRRRGVMK